MSLEAKEQQILSIISNAENWSEEDFKQNLEECWPVITNFIEGHEDSQVVMQIIRVAFTSFLPHVSILSESDVLVNVFLSSILKSLQNVIGEKETINIAEAEEHLECVLLCMECCKILLSFFLHFGETEGRLDFRGVQKVPYSASLIVNLSTKHYKKRKKFYTTVVPEIESLLHSLFKETIEGCTMLCEFISKISWADCSEEEKCSLSEVCENLSEIAHCFSCLSEVKVSVIAWKTFASLIQNHNEEIKRDIILIPTVDFLHEEIEEGLQMMKSFGKSSGQKLEENEEKIFDRVLKRTVFNLRILIAICDKFGGFLRGTYSRFLSLLLLLLRYSSGSFMFKTLPDNCKKKIDEQLMVGLFPLLSHLQKEKEFIQEVFDKFNQKFEKENYFEESEDLLMQEDNSSSEYVSFLLVFVSMAKQELADPFKESTLGPMRLILLKNIISTLPFCHPNFHCAETIPSFLHNYQSQNISLYSHILICTCAFVSTFDEQEFNVAEKLLFENALSYCPWKFIFTTDVLCFISRYGSASLCENHCAFIIATLRETPSMKRHLKKRQIMLLARLLGFAKVSSMQNILRNWLNEKPPKVMVAELLYYLRVPISEELQKIISEYILNEDQLLTSSLDTLTDDNLITIFEYFESAWLYLRSPLVDIEKLQNKPSLKNLASFLEQLFERFPLDYLYCSFVAKLFCLSLNLVPCLIKIFDEEGVYKIFEKCKKAVCNSSPNVFLCIANFVSDQSVVEYNVNKTTLKLIEEVFVSLLIQPGNFIRTQSIKALITFAQFTKHEEIFSSVVSRLPPTVSAEVTDYLQYVPQKTINNHKLFHQQMIYICGNKNSTENENNCVLVEIPAEVLKRSTSEALTDFHIEKSTKRRKLENNDNAEENVTLSDKAKEVVANLKTVEDNLRNNPNLKLELKDLIKKQFEEILAICDT